MDENPEICLCFHVRKRKLANWIRIERPSRVGQLSECYGAGTGCGWCRPYLQKMFDAATADRDVELPDSQSYASQRNEYIRAGKGKPPAEG